MTATPGGNDDDFRIVNAVLALSETADLLRTLEASPLTRSRAGAGNAGYRREVGRIASRQVWIARKLSRSHWSIPMTRSIHGCHEGPLLWRRQKLLEFQIKKRV